MKFNNDVKTMFFDNLFLNYFILYKNNFVTQFTTQINMCNLKKLLAVDVQTKFNFFF